MNINTQESHDWHSMLFEVHEIVADFEEEVVVLNRRIEQLEQEIKNMKNRYLVEGLKNG